MKLKANPRVSLVCLALAATVSVSAWAVVPGGPTVADADRLNKDLTPTGAERAGNRDGWIPAWTGGLTSAPSSWHQGNAYVDPFASEKPLAIVTTDNFDLYKDRLTPGDLALLKKYPNFKMPVYPSHRTASWPKEVFDKTRENVTRVRLNGLSIENYQPGSVPFPIPKSAVEVMYNHQLRYLTSIKRSTHWLPVKASGDYSVVRYSELIAPKEFIDGATLDNHLLTTIGYYEAPASLLGTIYLYHDPIDNTRWKRQAWVYNAGQRRLSRVQNMAYDNIDDGTEGMRTTDQYGGYSGAMDRYDWKLIGKKEYFIGYNTYKMADKKIKYADLVQKNTMNMDWMRYELHRVWVVEATLKPTMSHIYARRVFYIDEDSWNIAHEEVYDIHGKLWRVATLPILQRYDANFPLYHFSMINDLQNGQYIVTGLDNEVKSTPLYGQHVKWADVQVDALRRSGTR